MPLKWKRVWVSDESFESAGVFDVNGDGVPDIVSGALLVRGAGLPQEARRRRREGSAASTTTTSRRSRWT